MTEDRARTLGPWLVVSAVILAYGYEIFGNITSVDEPVLGAMGRWHLIKFWASVGRWAMGVTSITVPTTVVPVVSSGLGAAFLAASLWWISGEIRVGGWARPVIVAVCATLPMLTFHLLFSTNALGVGVAFVCLAGALRVLRWEGRLGVVAGIALTSYAVGTYDSFAVSAAVVPALAALRDPSRTSWVRGGVVAVGGVVLSQVIARAMRVVLGFETSRYVNGFFDLPGLVADPASKVGAAVAGTLRAFSLPGATYGRSSPWLALWLCLALVGVAWALAHSTHRTPEVAAAAAFLLAPVAAAAVVTWVPMQSMVYLPLCLLGLSALGVRGWARIAGRHRLLAVSLPITGLALGTLTTVSDAVLSNNVLAGAHTTLVRDQDLALRIDAELRRAAPEATLEHPVPVVVSIPTNRGAAQWQVPYDSLFMGARWTASDYLVTLGIPATSPSHEQWVAGIREADHMPAYPAQGWAKMVDGALVCNVGPVAPQFRDGGPNSGN